MIEPNEQYLISEDFHRENKEHFFGSPIWNEEGPQSIGSVITMKRQLYSSATSYGRGKLIILSLHPNMQPETIHIFTLEIPDSFPVSQLDNILKTLKPFPNVKLDLSLTEAVKGKIRVSLTTDPDYAQEKDYMNLLYSAIESWLQLNELTAEQLCKQADLLDHLGELEDFLENPKNPRYWIDFNLGFDLESFLQSEE